MQKGIWTKGVGGPEREDRIGRRQYRDMLEGGIALCYV